MVLRHQHHSLRYGKAKFNSCEKQYRRADGKGKTKNKKPIQRETKPKPGVSDTPVFGKHFRSQKGPKEEPNEPLKCVIIVARDGDTFLGQSLGAKGTPDDPRWSKRGPKRTILGTGV